MLAVAAAFLPGAPRASAEGEIVSIDSVTVAAGEQGTVDLSALGIQAPGLGAWTVDVVYDDSVVTPVACAPHAVAFCNLEFAPNTVRVTGARASGLQGDITLAGITFECFREGGTTLAPGLPAFADAAVGGPHQIAVAIQNGRITCTAGGPVTDRLGDANCDGSVNSIDAAIVLQFVAALIGSVPCPDNADADQDGDIDAIDAALILQHEAGLIDLGA